MAKFSEVYVETSDGKLYKFEDAEVMVAEQSAEDAVVQEQEVSAEELKNMPLLDVAKEIVEIASVDDWKAFLNSVRSTK